MRIITIVGVVLTLSCATLFASEPSRKQGEQRSFCEDEPVKHPVGIPTTVVKLLLSTAEVKQAVGSNTGSYLAHPERVFRASEVRLSNAGDRALIVLGSSPLSGADNVWFWLVRSPASNPDVLLFDGANCLNVLSSKSDGYRDIETVWSSASESQRTIYRYNGKRYREAKKTTPPR